MKIVRILHIVKMKDPPPSPFDGVLEILNSHLEPTKAYTLYLLDNGRCSLARDGVLNAIGEDLDCKNSRVHIMRALGVAETGCIEIAEHEMGPQISTNYPKLKSGGKVQLHPGGIRILQPLKPNPVFRGEDVPQYALVEDITDFSMVEWFRLLLQVLQNRPDIREIQPDPSIPEFYFMVPPSERKPA